ncbi:MAG TPA: helix-turn-helix domain-containing protein, partial [Actinomycetota bacterium]|nr:helix-turn-helix domain-containing protein [Actinomycetota bacterium]
MTGTGIGPALRKARLLRGKSIEEASRETRIRAEYLQALEGERFESLLGEVYVRGFLRSYSTYLGLDPSRVLSVYNRRFGSPVTPGRNGRIGPVPVARASEPVGPRPLRPHVSWPFLVGVTVLLMGLFAAVGLLARTDKPPGSDRVPGTQAAAPVSASTVTVGLKASADVRATVWVDAEQPVRFLLRTSEVRSFEGESSIRILLERGGLAQITVNDHDLGSPG